MIEMFFTGTAELLEMDNLRTDHQVALGKIDFLNDIIVDLQRKNEELKKNIKVLTDTEERRLNGDDQDESMFR